MSKCRLIYPLLMLFLSIGMGAQPRVRVLGFELGQDSRTIIKELKRQGFKVADEITERGIIGVSDGDDPKLVMDDFKYTFLFGRLYGYPASVSLQESRESSTVFEVEIHLLRVMDGEDGMNELDQIVARDLNGVPVFEKRGPGNPSTSLITYASSKDHVTKQLVFPYAGVIMDYYAGEQHRSQNLRYGIASYWVYDLNGREYIMEAKYTDIEAERLAISEAIPKKWTDD